MKRATFVFALLVSLLSLGVRGQPRGFTVVEATIPQMMEAMAKKQVTSRQLVEQYLIRIAMYEDRLNAALAINANALAEADALDRERAQGKLRGPLHGIPVALKDNIHTTDMPTTGGALVFAGYVPPYEATLTKHLKAAGAIIIAKTGLTELANWVAGNPNAMPGNYNAVGGFGFNPYDPRPDPRPEPGDGRPVLQTGGSSSGIGTAANFWAGDGTRLDGALLGSGRAGVVLLHESPNDLCGFWPYAVYLAGKGLRVLDIDLRCFGESACPVAAKGTVIDDAVAAVAELKRRGAGSVALVGASAGASVALAAGSRLGTGVAAVVSLSGERNLTLVIRDGGPVDLVNDVKRLTSPTLFEVATGDPTTSVDETRAMFAATRAPGKRIDVLTGPYDHEHGWSLLTTAAGAQSWSPVAAKVADFVRAHGAR